MVRRQTPFLYWISWFAEFSTILRFLDHRILGCGSAWTMHSNLANWPFTTAISFSGCKSFPNLIFLSNIIIIRILLKSFQVYRNKRRRLLR